MRRLTAHFTLAALLLFAQQGALSHQAWHIQDERAQHSGHQGKQNVAPGLCAFHLMFGTVLGAIGSAPSVIPLATNAVERNVIRLTLSFPYFAIIPASRGPPVPR
jgi:hypothetical protein